MKKNWRLRGGCRIQGLGPAAPPVGNFVSQNDDLQLVKHPISYIWVCFANTTKNHGYVAFAAALDVAESL